MRPNHLFVYSAHRKVLICIFVSVTIRMNMGRTLPLHESLLQMVSTHRYPVHGFMFHCMFMCVETSSSSLLGS